ncbi:Protein transport protein S9 plasma membrane t-SNARE [Coemansia sp. RSA 2599]|nr:Protein transport protein S9 plasma membrane t-SNARE [Coemansia sp. RSA 2598]KAJ1828700.1 Protein transport protein S9 plasma membrane t-SNARE [Coemansia sp. RSA 2599]
MSSYNRSSPSSSYASYNGNSDHSGRHGGRYDSDAERRTPRSGPGGSYGAAPPSGGYSSSGARPSPGGYSSSGARPSPGGYTSKYGSGNGPSAGGSSSRSNGTATGGSRPDTRSFAAASRDNRGQYQYAQSKYGAGNTYSQRQQSVADDDDDDDVDVIKSKITQVKQETLDSSRRALKRLEQTEDVGINTLTKLGEQSEQLNAINTKMEMTSINAENSVESTSKLRTLSKSIFHVHIDNPLKKKKRREEELAKLQAEQERRRRAQDAEHERNALSRRRVNQYNGSAAMDFRGPLGTMDANSGDVVRSGPRGSHHTNQGNSRYVFEDEDPEVEQEIDSNLDEMSNALSRLKGLAVNISEELDAQVKPMKNIKKTMDTTSDNIGISTMHLNRILKK